MSFNYHLSLISARLKHTFFLLATLLLVSCNTNGNNTQEKTGANTEVKNQKPLKLSKESERPTLNQQRDDKIPDKVYVVLAFVREHGRAPEGYQGGRKFGNYEKRLPLKDKKGNPMSYQEWDVNPKKKGKNRGAERLVTSKDKRAWYTRDHYDSFIEIR